MNPTIRHFKEDNNIATFTLTECYTSIANALRRTILSDISIFVFKTFPYEETDIQIMENTSRLNNEILKQRLSCIPIHIKDISRDMTDYLLEIKEENKSSNIMIVTSEHFKIKQISLITSSK
jgi:DNA-directed RNA polymerase alpha subunit